MCGLEVNLICPSVSSIYLWSPFNKLYAMHGRLFFFQQILFDDEVLKVLNILKLGAAVFVGTTWEETGASVVVQS